jgi:hypothetical protein
MGLRQLRTNAGRISSFLHKLGALSRASPAFQPSFLRRKVATHRLEQDVGLLSRPGARHHW